VTSREVFFDRPDRKKRSGLCIIFDSILTKLIENDILSHRKVNIILFILIMKAGDL